MVVSPHGTAMWLDSHTEDYFGQSDRGQRLAGSITLAHDRDLHQAHQETTGAVETTLESSVFRYNEGDDWNCLAVDEDEGKVAIGCNNGTILLLEYA